jgi:hypothetical protein
MKELKRVSFLFFLLSVLLCRVGRADSCDMVFGEGSCGATYSYNGYCDDCQTARNFCAYWCGAGLSPWVNTCNVGGDGTIWGTCECNDFYCEN